MTPSLLALWDEQPDGNVRQRLYAVLRQSIIRMTLAPGQALSEKEIADTFAVSRQPVREAFIRLSESGLIEVRPQRGTYVVHISQADVMEARFVREAIEIAVARDAAAQELTPAVRDELHELIGRQQRCIDTQDHDRFYRLDEDFHRTLALGTHHDAAWRVTQEVKAQLDRVRYLSVPDATPITKLVDQHSAILDAIEAHDADAAERAVKEHLREILSSLPALVERFPDLFEATPSSGHRSPLPSGVCT
ncbi:MULTISPECIES: GntR family transcriptional regulator [Chromohalobacter]|uniref:GntR family transcriptional regulator n=1 Tax=Chromohalobacter TaxID=42054 RepID=UPI001FFCE36C|nr:MULTISPECIES: GntR family transcriptional regulator [Chromohalobacter]MCK2045670.1 GntR family transcriptional regulator [Chromohalobacter moromii]MCT8468257.1 GntR family transcriptional regulator [Chromohalobacter canadensis]MCT8471312.1 GntR family transcriptional regulator [Chromohalobacter canadensis]MCT8498765.1 GntR family transcriptional regulator [Chromohalobacter canadensis]